MKAIFSLVLIGLVATAMCNVDCGDGTHCGNGQTCCPLETGYGCCPRENATCCEDKQSCCPSGYKCNVSAHSCIKEGNDFLSFVGLRDSLAPSMPAQLESGDDIKKCLADLPVVIADITTLYKDYEAKHIIKIIKDITATVAELKVTYEDCKNIAKDLVKAEFQRLSSISDIQKCLSDIPVFVQDIKTVLDDAKAKNINKFIDDLQATYSEALVLYGDCKDAVTRRLVSGDVDTCIADIEALVQDVAAFYADIKNKDIQKAIEDGQAIVAAAQQTIADCKA